MSGISDEQILEYVAANIDSFHDSRLARLNALKLDDLLERKNPYLFKSKNIVTVSGLISAMLDAYLSSQEEELFGVFLEGLAVFIASKTIGGRKSGITGIDLEFERGTDRYIVSIKSGPNWGNSSQVNKMKEHFTEAARVMRQGNRTLNVIAVNGCCYGRQNKSDKGTYFKICGQEFWELISNDRDLYTRIIEPLAHNAKQRNDAFQENYGPVVNRFCADFTRKYCIEGAINWPKLVALSSATTPLIARPARKYYINRLPDLRSVCDTLRNWEVPDLAEKIMELSSNEQPLDLESTRGFLMFFSSVEAGEIPTLESDDTGIVSSHWHFPGKGRLTVKFLNVDRLSVAVISRDGGQVKITNRDELVRRQTATRRLTERGWLSPFRNDSG